MFSFLPLKRPDQDTDFFGRWVVDASLVWLDVGISLKKCESAKDVDIVYTLHQCRNEWAAELFGLQVFGVS